MRLQGLSPEKGSTRQSAGKPKRPLQNGLREPATASDGMTGSRRRPRSGAVASRASALQRRVRMSIRFVPLPSPGSTGTSRPASRLATKELTRQMQLVRSQASGSSCQKRRIWGPLKRSKAVFPVSSNSRLRPPTPSSIWRHCSPVEVSIQIGAVGRENTSESCSARSWSGSRPPKAPAARLVEVDGAVLLAAAGDRLDPAEVDAGVRAVV